MTSRLQRKQTSNKEIQQLRKIIRESIETQIVLGEGWRDWFGLGKPEAQKADSSKEEYAAGEGRLWRALNSLSDQSSVKDVVDLWQHAIKQNEQAAKKVLTPDQKIKFDGIVDALKSIEKLEDIKNTSIGDVAKLKSLLSDIFSGLTNVADKIDKYKQSAKPAASPERRKLEKGKKSLYPESTKAQAESRVRPGRKI